MKKYIFIGGLHRSGTTLLANALKEHPDIRSFSDTGFPKDEGQFLQTVFPIAKVYGGPGKFGFRKEMHLTEKSPLATADNAKKIREDWGRQWKEGNIFLEKSPPNLLKTRFLQEIFENASFIIIYRHPVAVSLATKKWSKTSILSLLKHWLRSYCIYRKDKKYLKRVIEIKYEDFIEDPKSVLNEIYAFVDLEPYYPDLGIEKDINPRYFKKYRQVIGKLSLLEKLQISLLDCRFRKYGYRLPK